MQFASKQKLAHLMMVFNVFILALVLIISIDIDLNGTYFGLSYTLSTVIAAALFCIGIVCSVLTALWDHKKILLMILCIIIYVILVLPAFI